MNENFKEDLYVCLFMYICLEKKKKICIIRAVTSKKSMHEKKIAIPCRSIPQLHWFVVLKSFV